MTDKNRKYQYMKLKVKFGILSTASIAVDQVIPAMLKSKYCAVFGIASRTVEKAERAANQFQLPKYYGSYQELLRDPQIEAVYIPLPNHLHVEWAINALRAGKHVLVEKPIALNSVDAQKLYTETKKHPKLKIMEAFMYKHHPQWIRVKEMINNGDIGQLKAIQSSFSFFDDNLNSIVNIKEYGGGCLMDIGCYSISVSRLLFESEPKNILANIEYHPESKVDIMASGILEFERGYSTFISATQLIENQHVHIFGTEGRIELEMPFNPPIDMPSKICLVKEHLKKEIEFDICNQYTLQADAFSLAIIEDRKISPSMEDAINNMMVIERMLSRTE